MAGGGTARIWLVHATAAGQHAAAVARQGWHGDGPEPGPAGMRYHDIGYRACACRSTGRYGGRR